MARKRRTPQKAGGDSPAQEHEDTVQKGYDAAEEPERQGDGDPGPDPYRDEPGAQDSAADSGAQDTAADSGAQDTAADSGAQDTAADSGAQDKAAGSGQPPQPS
jgi:hypothetical protein